MADHSRKWWALLAVGIGVLMSTIDGSIVNIALSTLSIEFNSNLSAVEWVVLSYLLTITCLLLLMGRLGDMLGKRRIYLAGFVIFTIGSALCGLAPNIATLIGFRVFQGTGAAMIQAVGPALLVRSFPPRERGTALGTIGTFVAIGILIGPILGGILLRYLGWQWIFFVNLPIGLIAIALSVVSLPPDPRGITAQHFDYPGALLLLASLLTLLLGITEGTAWSWSDLRTMSLLLSSLVTGTLFVVWELHTTTPMIDLHIFRRHLFSYSLIAGFILFNALAFNLVLTPFFLQLVLGLDQQATGLVLISLPLTLSLVSPLSGRLSDRIGTRSLTLVGLVLVVIALIGISLSGAWRALVPLIGNLALLGIGVGLFQSPNNSVVMGNAPPEALGVASSLLAVMRTLGQTAGIAGAGAIWSSQVAAAAGRRFDVITSAPVDALAAGFSTAMLVGSGVAALALAPTLLGNRMHTRVQVEEQPMQQR